MTFMLKPKQGYLNKNAKRDGYILKWKGEPCKKWALFFSCF